MIKHNKHRVPAGWLVEQEFDFRELYKLASVSSEPTLVVTYNNGIPEICLLLV
jgi:hypothetical protein